VNYIELLHYLAAIEGNINPCDVRTRKNRNEEGEKKDALEIDDPKLQAMSVFIWNLSNI
jgi:hypothetical protein